ncbi:hypothetical protein MMC25_001024 [Agyrium rufum]|nr:hypothetical protein [Agyrium rufum]
MAPRTIYTPRLIIRTPQLRDAPAFTRIMTRPANIRLEKRRPTSSPTDETHREQIRSWRASHEAGTWSMMVITLPSPSGTNEIGAPGTENEGEVLNDDVIGIMGLAHIEPRKDKDGTAIEGGGLSANTGAMIDEPWLRRGYAEEGMRGTLDAAFRAKAEGGFGCTLITMGTAERNDAYRGLMRKLGLEGCGRILEPGEGVELDPEGRDVWYEIERETWEKVRDASK